MKKTIILFILLSYSFQTYGQDRKLIPLLWTSHSKNTDIVGVSVGIFPKEIFRDTTLTRTYGVKLEVPGIGMFFPLMPKSPMSTSDKSYEYSMTLKPSEIIYGIHLSTGANYQSEIYGFSVAMIGQYLTKNDGITIAGLGNLVERFNGISISGMGNENYKGNGINAAFGGNVSQYFNGIQIGGFNAIESKGTGIQIGLWNSAKNYRGIQLGLWNKNDKRSFPIINWQFKS